MNKLTMLSILAALMTAGLGAGCAPDQNAPTVESPTRDAAAPPEPATQAEAAGQKADAATADELQAGFEAIQPRVLLTQDAFNKVEAASDHRYFMHPSMDKDAVIEINTDGLTALSLAPRIGDLSAECIADPLGGSVRMNWSLDGAPPTAVTVDRQYGEVIVVDVSNAKKLKVEVNKGNEVVTCDWFGLGFVNVISK